MSSEDESSGWQLTESDPGVFTELLKTLGVPAQVDDLYSLDEIALAELQPIYALVFLFKWIDNADVSGGAQGVYDDDFPGFFAHQVVNNACATLAVMNALCNISTLQKGPQLQDLLSFTSGMDPQTSGLAITSSDFFREAHNALSPPSAISLDGLQIPREKEAAYHFVVYLPVAGSLYELDGLKRSPVKHGAVSDRGEGWIAKAREVIEARISTYPPGSLEFNLLAIHDDPLPQLQSQLQTLQATGNELGAAEIIAKISSENDKRSRWAFENSLRRHNHVGFLHAFALGLAKAGMLDAAIQKAKGKMKERLEKRKGEKNAMDQD